MTVIQLCTNFNHPLIHSWLSSLETLLHVSAFLIHFWVYLMGWDIWCFSLLKITLLYALFTNLTVFASDNLRPLSSQIKHFKISKQEPKKSLPIHLWFHDLRENLKLATKKNWNTGMYNTHRQRRGIHFLLLLLTCKKIQANLVCLTHNTWCPLYRQKIDTNLADGGNTVLHSKPESDLKLVHFMQGLCNFPRLLTSFSLCTSRQISGQTYASLGICLHNRQLKRSPLCKLRSSS